MLKFSDFAFQDPVPLVDWSAPSKAGIYAILVRDASCWPLPFRPICFGESANLAGPASPKTHPSYECWIYYAGAEGNLLIAVHLMPGIPRLARRSVLGALITDYRPACNQTVARWV